MVGAHYDSAIGSPGADDNASAGAGLLEIARLLFPVSTSKSIRFVAFTCEEPPFFMSRKMGSRMYARRCRRNKENIVGMVSLEMVGFYTRKRKLRALPSKILGFIHPQAGNYVAFVGNLSSRKFARNLRGEFRKHTDFTLFVLIVPGFLPGASWSDHSSFRKEGYKAIMVTDMAFYRNPHYHKSSDKPETLNYEARAEVVKGPVGALMTQ